MIALNLLSPNKKNRLVKLIKFLFVKEILEIMILTLSILAITHLFGVQVLDNFLSSLSQSTVAINKDYSKYNREIVTANALVKKVLTASSQYAPLSPYLTYISEILPPDIKLNTVQINRTSPQLTLSGTATTRESLLSFQDKLRKASWISEVSTPVSELFQKTNINFEVRASLPGLPPLTPVVTNERRAAEPDATP